MGKSTVGFCFINLAKAVNGSKEAKKILEKDPNIKVEEYACIHRCWICKPFPYALVNGEVVQGENTEELVKNIYQQIEKEESVAIP